MLEDDAFCDTLDERGGTALDEGSGPIENPTDMLSRGELEGVGRGFPAEALALADANPLPAEAFAEATALPSPAEARAEATAFPSPAEADASAMLLPDNALVETEVPLACAETAWPRAKRAKREIEVKDGAIGALGPTAHGRTG